MCSATSSSTGSNPDPSRPYPCLLLFGPTASGKTAIIRSVFIDDPVCPAEIISADSMQAYRGMDIGTAKPSESELRALPHHCIDIRNPDEPWDAGAFVEEADRLVPAILSRGALPVLSGGTAFYLANFLYGLPSAPKADAVIRARVARDLEEKGAAALREELREIDPESAGKIADADVYRLTRALEIARATGRPRSEFRRPDVPRARYEFLVIGISRPREELVARIAARVDQMLERGLEREVAALVASGYSAGSPGMKAIGYSEFLDREERGGIVFVRDRVIADTRRYAKRQMTFFRSLPLVRWFRADDAKGVRAEIAAFAKERAFRGGGP